MPVHATRDDVAADVAAHAALPHGATIGKFEGGEALITQPIEWSFSGGTASTPAISYTETLYAGEA